MALLVAFLLTLAFFVAKVTDTIDWSWFWVFSPFVFLFAYAVVVIGIFGGVVCKEGEEVS